MSIEKRSINRPHRKDEGRGLTSTATELSQDATACITCTSESGPNAPVSGSHPGLLALARILGRSAARADLRRTRSGAVAIMEMTDAMLVIAAVSAVTLVWSIILRLR